MVNLGNGETDSYKEEIKAPQKQADALYSGLNGNLYTNITICSPIPNRHITPQK